MTETRERWDPVAHDEAYTELEHPSDLLLEIRGRELGELFENALFAFYRQVAQIEGFEAQRELTLRVREPELDEALRSLLSEALYTFDTEGFVAVGGRVAVEGPAASPAEKGGEAGGRAQGAGKAGGAPSPVEGARHGALLSAGEAPPGGDWRLLARLWGDRADRQRHTLLHEIKAVTYHRLEVREDHGGWKATVLFDI